MVAEQWCLVSWVWQVVWQCNLVAWSWTTSSCTHTWGNLWWCGQCPWPRSNFCNAWCGKNTTPGPSCLVGYSGAFQHSATQWVWLHLVEQKALEVCIPHLVGMAWASQCYHWWQAWHHNMANCW